MQIDDLEGRTQVPVDKLRKAVGDAEVLAALPGSADGLPAEPAFRVDWPRDSVLVATRTGLLIVSERPGDPSAGVDEMRSPWDYTEVSGAGWSGPETVHGLSVRVRDRTFHASLSGDTGREAVTTFESAARQVRAKPDGPMVAAGCPTCGALDWHRTGSLVGTQPAPDGSIFVTRADTFVEGPSAWTGLHCGHDVPADTVLYGFLDSLPTEDDAPAMRLPPNR